MDTPEAGAWTAVGYALAGVALLGCNFFFVMSEFAIVKLRDSQVAALALANDPRAALLKHMKSHLEEYLSVVQVGITGATLGMGLVIDEGIGQLVRSGLAGLGWSGPAAGATAVVLAFAIATFLTIVTSELVPKAIAIRDTERAALIAARPMRLLHRLLWLPILVLNSAARGLLRLLGFGRDLKEIHSEEELRIILGESQDGGVMPFRRLLLFENLFDLGGETVRDAMRPRAQVKSMPADATRQDMAEAVLSHGYSRYPLVPRDADSGALPIGIVHAKEALARLPADGRLSGVARPFLTFRADAPLEQALAEFQRSRNHLAVVVDGQGRWIGLLSFEDVIEEIIGAIEDEFERDQPLHLDELLGPQRIILGLHAGSIDEAVGEAMRRLPPDGLPPGVSPLDAARLLLDRERSLSTYVGRGIAIPHARVEGLERPLAAFVRLDPGVPVANRRETARFLFILLVPAGAQRLHLRLLARIAQIAESDYILERLAQAGDAAAVQEALAAGDRIASG
jgi:CBS domain containing-hemolysin-like protein/mannitol/fructose-specific phosphotransferase system IIA component (Ntr-type)